MKNIVVSVGLVAIGATGLQVASAQDIGAPDKSKPWSVSATLRGFYDDNINSAPSNANLGGASRDSFGVEVSPSAMVGIDTGPTTASLGYTFSAKWYENRPAYNADNWDLTHDFNAALTHAFNERYNVTVRDSFVIGQEPDFLRAGNSYSTFQRIPGDNIRNLGAINFGAELTRQVGLELGYSNAYFDYADNTTYIQEQPVGPPLVAPSRSALLDRMEQTFHLDGRWHLQPQTTAILGYQYSQTDYLADQIVYFDSMGNPQFSDVRNNRSHYGYVGADHSFRPDLTASARVGVRYTDYFNDPSGDTDLGPYARLSMRYHYLPDSYVEGGFTYDLSATDLIGFNGQGFTRSSETANLFASLHHQITPKLSGSLTGQFQNSSYNGGAYNNQTEQFLLAGINLQYRFNRYFSGDVGYNYDKLISDIGRGFDRNRVYIGLTASY